MNEIIIVSALLCASLLVGNEFAIGVFINPLFGRLPEVPQAYATKESARIYGKVMPFWMITNFILCLLLTFVVPEIYSDEWWFYLTATSLFVLVTVFSVIFPVPINTKITDWNPNNLPDDWRELRKRFNQYHFVRIFMLIIAQVSLIIGTILHSSQ